MILSSFCDLVTWAHCIRNPESCSSTLILAGNSLQHPNIELWKKMAQPCNEATGALWISACSERYWALCEQPHVHCSHMERGPKFVKKGTKRGPDLEWKGTKRGPSATHNCTAVSSSLWNTDFTSGVTSANTPTIHVSVQLHPFHKEEIKQNREMMTEY